MSKTVDGVPREASLAVPSLDVLDQAVMDIRIRALEHDTDACGGIATLNHTVSDRDVGGTVSTDRIFRPGDFQVINACKVVQGSVVTVSHLDALAGREGSSDILHHDVLKNGVGCVDNRDASGPVLSVDILEDETFCVLDLNVAAVVSSEGCA